MLNNQQTFETKNIAVGNSVVKTRKSESYMFSLKNGNFGTSNDYPKEEKNDLKSLTKFYDKSTDFAEDYDEQNETALTWYYFKTNKVDNIVVDENRGPIKPSSIIEILFYNLPAYLETVRQVDKFAKYIGIKEMYGRYFSEYEHNGIIIRLKKSNDSQKPSIIKFIKGNYWLVNGI